jgi:hypothetical protein
MAKKKDGTTNFPPPFCCCCWTRDPEWKISGFRIWDKHTGSTTLVYFIRFDYKNKLTLGRLEALGSILDMLQLSNFPTTSIIKQITAKRKKSAFSHFLAPEGTVSRDVFSPISSYLE